jgi:DNA-binding MurR/RpiR family transcriptional regulator
LISPEFLFQSGPVQLTKSQTKVVAYLYEHPEKAVFMTAAQLGRHAGVSDATVVRLAQKLGYDRFIDMKNHLREQVMTRLDTVSRMQKTTGRIQGLEDALTAVLEADVDNVTQTVKATSVSVLSAAVRTLQSAEEIYILALRTAHGLALVLSEALRFLGRRPYIVKPGIGDLWDQIRFMRPGCVLVAVSFPRYTKLTVEAAQSARHAGATVISLTDSMISPLAACSDYLLPADFQIDSYIESYVASLSLINALATGVAFLDGSGGLAQLKGLEEVWAEKKIYHTEDEWAMPTWAVSEEE